MVDNTFSIRESIRFALQTLGKRFWFLLVASFIVSAPLIIGVLFLKVSLTLYSFYPQKALIFNGISIVAGLFYLWVVLGFLKVGMRLYDKKAVGLLMLFYHRISWRLVGAAIFYLFCSYFGFYDDVIQFVGKMYGHMFAIPLGFLVMILAFFTIRLGFAPFIVIERDSDFGTAFKYSWQLTEGNFFKLCFRGLGLLLVVYILIWFPLEIIKALLAQTLGFKLIVTIFEVGLSQSIDLLSLIYVYRSLSSSAHLVQYD